MNKYYVYKHIRLDTNTPFYVGKGQNNRAYHLVARSNYHQAIRKKHGCKVIILMSDLTEEEAYKYELEWILTYKAHGFCEANFSLGGRHAATGLKRSPETLKKMSVAHMGNTSWKGKHHSEESKLKLSITKNGKEFNVFNRFSGQFIGKWINQSQCAKDLGIRVEGICKCLAKSRVTAHGYIFEYRK